MKLVAFLLVLIAASSVWACNPDSNNKPVCTKNNVNRRIRNFYDPLLFWFCAAAGAEPKSEKCIKQTDAKGPAFNATTGNCVSWEEWVWTPYCPGKDSV